MAAEARFSSRLGAVVTLIGVAVGLGNVWRFPYMMGRHGGSAFLAVYLVFLVAFAVPALMAEWELGRSLRRGPLGCFRASLGPRVGTAVGCLLLLTILTADSYYLVILSQVIYTVGFGATRGFAASEGEAYTAGLNAGGLQYTIALTLLALTLWVLHRGLRRGIEAASRVVVPGFAAVTVWLVVHALTREGAMARTLEFLRPDLSLIGPAEAFAALGQAFFSLGLGGTFMVVYGSYLKTDTPLGRTALATSLGDAGAAVLASLFVVPTVLIYGLDMTSGPQLVFETLPVLFARMPAGDATGVTFLGALALVAFLSNVAALEVFVAGVTDGAVPSLTGRRTHALVLVAGIEAVLILPSALHPPLIGTLDLIFGSGMQVLGGALAVIALTWGLRSGHTLFAALPPAVGRAALIWLRWGVPGALVAILIGYLVSVVG